MDNRSSPEISSFVLRFVQEKTVELADQPIVRGSIRHIQTGQELSFTHWIDAVNFMRQFVPRSVFDLSNASTHFTEGCEEPK
jgi:hypothetical protein